MDGIKNKINKKNICSFVLMAIALLLTVIGIAVPIALLKTHKIPATFIFMGQGLSPDVVNLREGSPDSDATSEDTQVEFTTRRSFKGGDGNETLSHSYDGSDNDTDSDGGDGFNNGTNSYGDVTQNPNGTNDTSESRLQGKYNKVVPPGHLKLNPLDYVTDYLNDDQLKQYFDNLLDANKGLIKKDPLDGVSRGKRPIDLIRVQKPGKEKLPALLIISGIKGCDWKSILLTIYLFNRILQKSKTTLETLDHYNFLFIPVLNPDGYNFTMHAPKINMSYPFNAAGVDLVTDIGGKQSEPETQFLLDIWAKEKAHIKLVLLFISPDDPTNTVGISLPERLRNRKAKVYSYFQEHKYQFFQIYSESRPEHFGNWAVEQNPNHPVVTHTLKILEFRDGRSDNNGEFLQTYGHHTYNLIITLISNAKLIKKEGITWLYN